AGSAIGRAYGGQRHDQTAPARNHFITQSVDSSGGVPLSPPRSVFSTCPRDVISARSTPHRETVSPADGRRAEWWRGGGRAPREPVPACPHRATGDHGILSVLGPWRRTPPATPLILDSACLRECASRGGTAAANHGRQEPRRRELRPAGPWPTGTSRQEHRPFRANAQPRRVGAERRGVIGPRRH